MSSNELIHLPSSMGEMISLKDLNIRRNRLEVLPDGKCYGTQSSIVLYRVKYRGSCTLEVLDIFLA